MPYFSYLSILKNDNFVIHDYLLWPVAGRTRMKPCGLHTWTCCHSLSFFHHPTHGWGPALKLVNHAFFINFICFKKDIASEASFLSICHSSAFASSRISSGFIGLFFFFRIWCIFAAIERFL